MPLVFYSIFSSSTFLAVGPTAIMSLLTQEALHGIDTHHDEELLINLVIILTFMVGIITTLLGIFRLGIVSNFLSHSVLSGFTSAAAIIIALSQLKHLLGFDIPRSPFPLYALIYALGHITETKPAAVSIGLISIVILLMFKYSKRYTNKYLSNIDKKDIIISNLKLYSLKIFILICNLAPLFVVLAATGISSMLYLNYNYTTEMLPIVGNVTEGYPTPRVPQLSKYSEYVSQLLPSAFILSIIGKLYIFIF